MTKRAAPIKRTNSSGSGLGGSAIVGALARGGGDRRQQLRHQQQRQDGLNSGEDGWITTRLLRRRGVDDNAVARFVTMKNATTFQTGSRNDDGAERSDLRLLRSFHNPPETSSVWAGPTVADEAQLRAQYRRFRSGLWLARALGAYAPEYQSHHRHSYSQCEGLEMIEGERELDVLVGPSLVHYGSQHRQILSISTIRRLMAEPVAKDKVKVPFKCKDRDKGLVRHRDRDRDNMFHMDWDFNVLEVTALGLTTTHRNLI
ncbi:hypothetical protein Syun_023736 [Stephania yunnanensis]|uniref:Uncharacterized protein n=1 Tax=Stephania yunnanensis TaxID=152371 RepID=A0AAP0F9G6_9MAGN